MVVEMAEAARMGLRTGLLMLRGPIIWHPFPVHPQIRRLLEDGAVERIDPAQALSARLVLVHHPSVLEHPLSPRPRILAGQLVIVLHHPARDAAGTVQYDLNTVLRHARMGFDLGADAGTDAPPAIWLAPVSAVVRYGLSAALPQGAQLLPDDWTNLIDLADWPPRAPRQSTQADRFVLGRHARPDRKKWPDTAAEAFAAWPTPPGWRVRALGADAALLADYGTLPAAWDLLPFNAEPVPAFLHSLDAWVYFHSSAWSEAFGRATLEAMACGVCRWSLPRCSARCLARPRSMPRQRRWNRCCAVWHRTQYSGPNGLLPGGSLPKPRMRLPCLPPASPHCWTQAPAL